MASREHQFEIDVDGVGFRVVTDERGRPIWNVAQVPKIAGREPSVPQEDRPWRSFHGGFGWSHAEAANVYHYATNLDCRYPRTVIMGPLVTSFAAGGTVTRFFEQSSALYAVAGRYVKKVDTTDDHCETPDDGVNGKDLGAGITAVDALAFDGNTYVTIGDAGKMWRFTGSAWSQASNNTYGSYLTSFWAETFYALARTCLDGTDPSVAWCSEGLAPLTLANWNGANNNGYKIGDLSSTITGIAAVDRNIYVGKTNGLYGLDATTRTPRLVPVYTVSAANGKALDVDSAGYVWMPSAEGYYRYSVDGGAVDCSPGRGLPNTSPIYGTISAHTQYKGWRYASVYNGTDSYIMCGRERGPEEPGVGPMLWHGALAVVSSAQVQGMWITSLTTPPRLYFGSGTNVGYFRLPSNGDNPLLDSTYRFAASGSLYIPTDDWGVPGMTWRLMGFEVENEGLSSTTYLDLYAQINHSGGWQLLGRAEVAGNATVKVSEVDSWRFNRAAFRLDITNSSSTSTPKIRAIVGTAARRAKTAQLITTTVYCSDNAISRFGLPRQISGLAQLTHLEALHNLAPITLKDWWTGRLRERRVLVQPIPEQLAQDHGDSAADQMAELTMLMLDDQSPAAAYYGTAIYGVDRYG